MKIVFYAPDTALPSDFTPVQADAFRTWALMHLTDLAAPTAGTLVEVSAEALIDQRSLLVVIEGGTPQTAAAVQTYCIGLVPRFRGRHDFAPVELNDPQSWIGGFCRWVH